MEFSNICTFLPVSKPKECTYAELVVYGLNYSLRRKRRRKILLQIQFAKNFVLKPPVGIVTRIFKRRLAFFGQSLLLSEFVTKLVALRPGNIHTGKGLRMRSTRYRIKPAKGKRKSRK